MANESFRHVRKYCTGEIGLSNLFAVYFGGGNTVNVVQA